MRLMTPILFLLAASLTAADVAAERSYSDFFEPTFGDFTEELERAREEDKKLLLYFHMETCPFCERMERNVLNRAEVQDFYGEHFLSFMVDTEGAIEVVSFEGEAMEEREFALRHRARATPVFAFFDGQGEPLARFTGATSSVEEFLWLGEYVVQGIYEEKPFARYRRERENQGQ